MYAPPPPAWLAALLLLCFGLAVSAPAALGATWLYDRYMVRHVRT